MRNKLSLTKALTVLKGDIVSLTGAGGKTSCLYKLGLENKEQSVLLTTTTRMKCAEKGQVDFVYAEEELENLSEIFKTGRTFLYGKGQPEGKCGAVSESKLKELVSGFDLTIIEADGSRMLPLKGYLDREPCIPDFTTLTVGVITTQGLGKPADPSFILRWQEFRKMTELKQGEIMKEQHLAKWIAHPRGMFKGSPGRKVLFWNQMEREIQIKKIENVINCLDKQFIKGLSAVTAGSVKNDVYQILWTGEDIIE